MDVFGWENDSALSLKTFFYDWLNFFEIINFGRFKFLFNINKEKELLNKKKNPLKAILFLINSNQ